MPQGPLNQHSILRMRIDQLRRRIEQGVDQAAALAHRRMFGPEQTEAFNGKARFALVTVNFSTLRWLKLMLLTLCEQNTLELVADVVIVDNDSKDGSVEFLRELAAAIPSIQLIENKHFLSHARGMRLGFNALTGLKSTANVVLSIDTDVIFLRQDTLQDLAREFEQGSVLAGEMRDWLFNVPEAQASFVATRRDVMARRDMLPWVNHGAPSYWMQKSIRKAELPVSDFRNYSEGYTLHRGRAGVAAAKLYRPGDSYASVANNEPHFMGIPGGAQIWHQTEIKWEPWLSPDKQGDCIDWISRHLASK